jgi:hypothetical protein
MGAVFVHVEQTMPRSLRYAAAITFSAKYDGEAHTNSLWTNGCSRYDWQMIVRSTPPPYQPIAAFASLGSGVSANGYFSPAVTQVETDRGTVVF